MQNKILKLLKNLLICLLVFGTFQGIIYREKYEIEKSGKNAISEKYDEQKNTFEEAGAALELEIAQKQLAIDLLKEEIEALKEEINCFKIYNESLELENQKIQEEIEKLKEQLNYKTVMGLSKPTALITSKEVLNESKQPVGSITIQNFDVPNLGWKDKGYFYLYEVGKVAKDLIPNGMPLAGLLAIAYNEGGAGYRGVYRNTNNCFGMKASPNWEGWVYDRKSGQVYCNYKTAKKFCQSTSDLFRAYPSIKESIQDHINTILNPLYAKALNKTTTNGYLTYLINHGYGSKNALSSWKSIIEIYKLEDWARTTFY